MVKLDPWIDKPRFASSQGDQSLVASHMAREGSTMVGRVLAFEAGGARVEYPADAPVSEGWGPTDGGVSAVGAIVRVLIGSDGRIVLISSPDVLPPGSVPYSTGATGDVVFEAVALSEAARAENAATHAEVVQAQQDLADARDHIENVVEPGLVAAQGAADAAAGEAVQAKADALAAFNKAMQGVTDASAAQSLASQAVQDAAGAKNAAQAAQGTANTAATDLLTLAGRTGRLIRSATAPTAAVDKNANNLWLNTSTGQLHEWTGTAWVVVTDSRITAAASAADQAANLAGNAQTAANTAQTLAQAAQSAASTADGKAVAAQSTANTAVSNAQAAQGVADTAKADAAAAAGIAGGKADVLIQSTTPVAGMRKATTLWIDTTGGLNTPKRWSGSAWIAVTDKAATDAATAAASAQTTANTAITNAQSAQTTANTALADAAAAKTAANNAQASALGAQSTADTANQKASTADGRYTVATANPTVSDASGKPLNAVWEVRSGGTAVRRYVLTGATTWTQVRAGQDFVGEKAIGQAQIADVAVGTAQIADAAITNAKVGDLAVDKLTVTGGATFPTAVVNTLTGQNAFLTNLVAKKVVIAGDPTNKVGSVLIEDGAVTAPKVNATSELWAKVLAVAGNATIGGDLLANGAVTARTMNVVSETSGRFMSMKPDGLRLWDSSSDEESPLVSLTTGSEKFFATTDGVGSVLASIDSAGGMTGVAGAFRDSLSLSGVELADMLWDMPRGLVARGARTMAANIAANGTAGIGSLTFTPEADRLYKVTAQGPSYSTTGYMSLQMRWAGDDAVPKDAAAMDTVGLAFAGTGGGWGTPSTTRYVAAGQVVEGGQVLTAGRPATVFFAIGSSAAATLSAGYKTFFAAIEDVGSVNRLVSDGASWVNRDWGASGNPSAPTTVRTVEVVASASASYLSSGAAYSYMGNKVTQGSWGSNSAMRGVWIFPSVTSQLSGGTGQKVELYIPNLHTRWNNGATIWVFPHANASLPATVSGTPTPLWSFAFKKGEAKWVDITSAYASLKSGAYRGFGIYSSSGDHYAYCGPGAHLKVTHTK